MNIGRDRLPTGGNRLDPMLIGDALVRAKLYADIQQQTPFRSSEHWRQYIVSPGESLLPELISARVWGDASLKWVVMTVAGLDDPMEEIEAGTTLNLPSETWLRDRIKFYQALDSTAIPSGSIIRIGTAKSVTLPEQPPLPPTGSSGFENELMEAILALAEPLPTVLPSDSLNETTLNKQARASEEKMDKLRRLLEAWRDG